MTGKYFPLLALSTQLLAACGQDDAQQKAPAKVAEPAKSDEEPAPPKSEIPTTKYSARENQIHDELLELIKAKREKWDWDPKTKEEVGAHARKSEESEAEANREIAAKYMIAEEELEKIFLKVATERVAIQTAKNKARNAK
ncbi:MAG: hypothetical protein KC468_16165 [Myxococcales bacterium]|nr:hypothetical protein [Myxococcales bacterium]